MIIWSFLEEFRVLIYKVLLHEKEKEHLDIKNYQNYGKKQ